MQNKPFFSIIVVCLNAGNSLKKTVDSVLLQDFTDFEIIIKDGLSTDGSLLSIVEDERIVKVKKHDDGIYDAMNQAIDYVKGKFVLFLNAADCFADQSVLTSYYNEIINNNYPELVYCDYTTTKFKQYVQSPPQITPFFLFRTMLCHQVCMYKKTCYDNFGNFDLSFKVDADYEFLLRTVLKHKIKTKHFHKLVIISKSDGFSTINSNLAKKEVNQIRKRYFDNNYYLFSIILKLTFPSLRMKLVSKETVFSKLYQNLVNLFNKL